MCIYTHRYITLHNNKPIFLENCFYGDLLQCFCCFFIGSVYPFFLSASGSSFIIFKRTPRSFFNQKNYADILNTYDFCGYFHFPQIFHLFFCNLVLFLLSSTSSKSDHTFEMRISTEVFPLKMPFCVDAAIQEFPFSIHFVPSCAIFFCWKSAANNLLRSTNH